VAGTAIAQEKWALLQDMSEEWLYYDEEWLPLTNRLEKYDAVHFRLPEKQGNLHLMIKYPGRFSVFLNEQIYYTSRDSLMVNADSLLLATGFQDPLVTIYAPDIQPNYLRTHLLFQYNPDNEPEPSNVVNIIRRKSYASRDFIVVAFLLLLFLMVLLKVFYPRNFGDFYNISKTFSSRNVEEDFLRGRLFSQINLIIISFQCLIIGLFITLLIVHLNIPTGEEYKNVPEYMVLWLKFSSYMAVFIILKFILIRNFTSLYNLYSFTTPHFMSYLRIVTLTFSLGLLFFYWGIYTFGWEKSALFYLGLNFVLILLGLGIFFIYLKLINSASYKKVHLFSYLCATEILPYVVILKVAINQSI
jgi:hypothetical protein